jgi:hypothetical protein
MTDLPALPRYTEPEMALILKRAAELQEGASSTGAELSLAQIQEIAAEAGISPACVAEAAAELRRPTPRSGWLGGVTRFHHERTVEGHLATTGLGELLDVVRAEVGLHGDVSSVLGSLEWRGRDSLGVIFVTMAPRTGGTRIAVTAARNDQAALVSIGSILIGAATALVGLAVAMQLTDSALLTSGVVAGSWIAGSAVSARLLWRGVSAKWRARARDIGDAVAERAVHIVAREQLQRIS